MCVRRSSRSTAIRPWCGDTVSLGYNTYNMLKSKIELLSSLVEGQNDIIQGRTTTLDEAFNSIDKMLDQMG